MECRGIEFVAALARFAIIVKFFCRDQLHYFSFLEREETDEPEVAYC